MVRKGTWAGHCAEAVSLEDGETAAREWREAIVVSNQQGTYGAWTEEHGTEVRVMIGRHDDEPVGGVPPVIRIAHKRAREARAAAESPQVVVPFPGQATG